MYKRRFCTICTIETIKKRRSSRGSGSVLINYSFFTLPFIAQNFYFTQLPMFLFRGGLIAPPRFSLLQQKAICTKSELIFMLLHERSERTGITALFLCGGF